MRDSPPVTSYNNFSAQIEATDHRRRIYTEEKAKVDASVWGAELMQFLAALAILHQEELDDLHQDDIKI